MLGADFARAMIPIFILQTWLLGLLSLSVIGGAVYLAHEFSTSDFIALKLFLGVVLLKNVLLHFGLRCIVGREYL